MKIAVASANGLSLPLSAVAKPLCRKSPLRWPAAESDANVTADGSGPAPDGQATVLVRVHATDAQFGGGARLVTLVIPLPNRLLSVRELRLEVKARLERLLRALPGNGTKVEAAVSNVRWCGAAFGDSVELDNLLPLHQAVVLTADATVRDVDWVALTGGATVQDVKDWLHFTQGIPAEGQRLLFAGRQLSELRSLSHYKVTDGATLHLVPALEGGAAMYGPSVRFVDVSNAALMQLRPWSAAAPLWRIAEPGLTVEGECRNRTCEAYGNMVITNQRFGTFDLLLDSVTRCKCPCCGGVVTPETCAFNNTEWRFMGIKMSNGSPDVVRSEGWKLAGNQYERFKDGAQGQVGWTRLVIVTRAVAPSDPTVRRECPICIEQLPSSLAPRAGAGRLASGGNVSGQESVTTATCCGATFHAACLGTWKRVTSSARASCPCCRSTAAV